MSEKYRVMDSETIEASKKWAIKKVKEWHDKVKPDCVILTETSAVPYGWLLKNAWKEMYPDEKVPKFFRSAIGFSSSSDPRMVDISRDFPGSGKNNYFAKRNIDSKKTALIFDETERDQTEKNPSGIGPRKAYENGQIDKSFMTRNYTLQSTVSKFRHYFENISVDSGKPDAAMHARGDLNTISADDYTYVKPTKRESSLSEEGNLKKFYDMEKSFTGFLEKNPKLRKRALAYVHDLKLAGKEAGIEARQEEQKKKSLEHRVTSIITIASLATSLIFLSSNLTGNAIANLSVKTSSFIGLGLFAITLISGFFWLRNRKS